MKSVVSDIIKEIDPIITMHDFRIVDGPTHTNLIFDIVIPFEFKHTDDAVIKLIASKIRTYNPDFYVVINVDKSYT